MSKIGELKNMLENVSDSYFDFVDSIICDCKAQNVEFTASIIDFINENPNAKSSEIIEYELYMLGLPYCNDKGEWYQKDKKITEEQARVIVETDFNDD